MPSNRSNRITKAVRGRVGPVGLSLAAAALTAVALAAVSTAQDDSGSKSSGNGYGVTPGPGGPPGGAFLGGLSEENKQALEEFRQCLADEGVEPPPRPKADEDGRFERRPELPSEAQREKLRSAFEACQDKLPEGAEAKGPHPCGPPPGADGEGAAIPAPPPGSGSRQEGTSAPAQQGSTS